NLTTRFVTESPVPVNGTVTSARCVTWVRENGQDATITGSGSYVSFRGSAAFASETATTLTITVQARDCDSGDIAQVQYTGERDVAGPVSAVQNVAAAPQLTSVVYTPFAVHGTVTEKSLAGVTTNDRSVSVVPGAGADQWDFAVDVVLTRGVDNPLVVEAWDF